MSWPLLEEILNYVLPFPHLLANCAVIFLSFHSVRQCTLRTYALNLTIPSLGYSIYSIVLVILKLCGRGRRFGIRTDFTDFFAYFGDAISYLCGYDYRMLAIVLVGLTFVSFAKPLFANKHLSEKIAFRWFLLAHVLAILFSAVSTISANQSQELFLNGTRVSVNWSDYAEGAAEIGTFLMFLMLYVVCIREIVIFNRQQNVLREASRDQRRLKKQLLAILCYITPPTIFLIPYSLCTDITTAFIPATTPVYKQICDVKVHFYGALITLRYFIGSFTILIAFADYRRAIWSILNMRTPSGITILHQRSTGVHSSSYM